MDVSPKTLREVEFREKMRGYHPEDVDQFLERVAAGIEVLQDRLRQAIERAQRAEQAATEAGGNDDALRRTLLLAQRTADLAVQEAREQAARLVASAEQQAQAILGDAEQRVHALVGDAEQRAQATLADSEHRSKSMVNEAEQRARRGHDEALVEVRAELAKLEVTRQRLQMDVDAMTRWVAEHRGQLRAALEEALTRVEQIDVTPPPAAGAPYPLDSPAANTAPAPAPAPAPRPGPVPVAGATSPASPPPAQAPPAKGAPATGADASWAPPGAFGPSGSAPAPGAPGAPAGFPAPKSAPPIPAPAPAPGWPQENTMAWRPSEADLAADEPGDADPYFAELRRAISDHDPLGPRPDGDAHGATGD